MSEKNLRDQSIDELKTSLSEARRQQFKFKLVKSSGELTSTHKLKEVRRKIARLMTILAEKGIHS